MNKNDPDWSVRVRYGQPLTKDLRRRGYKTASICRIRCPFTTNSQRERMAENPPYHRGIVNVDDMLCFDSARVYAYIGSTIKTWLAGFTSKERLREVLLKHMEEADADLLQKDLSVYEKALGTLERDLQITKQLET